MATSTSDVTGNSALAVRGNNTLTQGLVAAAIAGSVLIANNLHFDLGANQNPAIKAGTGTVFQSYDGQAATVLTNTGSRQTYTAGSFVNASTGTQSLLSFKVDFNKLPVAGALLTCHSVFAAGATATGDLIFKYKAPSRAPGVVAGSGGTISASGAQLGVLIVPGGGGRCWFDRAPGPGVKAKIRVIGQDQYIP